MNRHCFDADLVLDPNLHVDTNPHAADPTTVYILKMLKNKKNILLLFTAVPDYNDFPVLSEAMVS